MRFDLFDAIIQMRKHFGYESSVEIIACEGGCRVRMKRFYLKNLHTYQFIIQFDQMDNNYLNIIQLEWDKGIAQLKHIEDKDYA